MNEQPAISPEFAAILACPNCASRPHLDLEGDKLTCPTCGRIYPILEGIPQLLPESAINEPKNA